MAGAKPKYRHLSRSSSHRQALLRNLCTSLFTHETIRTTYPKAKEAQRLAEKLITLGKRNTDAARKRALSIFYTPHELIPKLFGPLRERYANRPGGYTRVLRIEPLKADQAPSAILELVDGERDMRFAMTAKTLARMRVRERDGEEDVKWTELTERNVKKVTAFRPRGEERLEQVVGGLVREEERKRRVENGEKVEEEEEVEQKKDGKVRRVVGAAVGMRRAAAGGANWRVGARKVMEDGAERAPKKGWRRWRDAGPRVVEEGY